jgi:peptidoglycan/LPS O-acetylase OafA/YrhL
MHVGAPVRLGEAGSARSHAGRNIAIQQLRGIAILLVLVQHFSLPNSLIAAFTPGIVIAHPPFRSCLTQVA